MDYPLLFPGQWKRAGLKVESLEYEPVPIWDAHVTGNDFILYVTVLVPHMIFPILYSVLP